MSSRKQNRLLDLVSPLLRLSPTGWCRVIEKLALLDFTLLFVRAEEAIIGSAAGELVVAPLPNPISLIDHLKRQALVNVARRDYVAISNLIEEIDEESGHFKGDLLELSIILGRPATDLEELLRDINHFHPLGCGASTLHQALRCQIPELPEGTSGDIARLLLTDYWDLFSGGGREILSEISGLGHQAIDNGISAIRKHLTPYPAERFWGVDGTYLKRSFCYRTDLNDGRSVLPPHESQYYLAQKPEELTDISLIVTEALKLRRESYNGICTALSKLDLDDPCAKVSLASLAHETSLMPWSAWQLTQGEAIVDISGERKYIRELIGGFDMVTERLLNILDNEMLNGKPESDASLGKLVSRGGTRLSVKDIANIRDELGIPSAKIRGDRTINLLLQYGLA